MDCRLADLLLEKARSVASLFCVSEPIDAFEFPGKGNINQHTFIIRAGPPENRSEYLLQLLNQQVFKRPQSVMEAMAACIKAQQEAIARGALGEDEEWEPIRLVSTRTGMPYLEASAEGGYQCWRMMIRIPNARSYQSLSKITGQHERLRTAEEAGKGLSLFRTLTMAMDTSRLGCSLPGYRDTSVYYAQLLSVLAGNRTTEEAAPYLPADPIVRQSTEQHFLIHLPPEDYRQRMEDPEVRRLIRLARNQKSFGLTLLRGLSKGKLPKVLIHGDTKLDNFLFSIHTGKAIALVDLDTIMPYTWLADWGDMVRSLVNVSGEREQDLEKVQVDMDVLRAAARGFLRSSRGIRTEEAELMTDAIQILSLELGVRFLADYLRGNSYFKLSPKDPWDLNKIRAMVQFSLFEQLRKKADDTKRIIDELCRQFDLV